MPKSNGSGYEVLYIKVPDRLMDQLGEVCQEDRSVTEGLYSQLELMTQDLIKRYISTHRERKAVEDNLDLFSV